MVAKVRYFIIFVLALIPLSTSAPFCETLDASTFPFHANVPPMTTASPYQIITSGSTAHQSEILTIRIKSLLSEINFGGFIVHAFGTRQPEKVLGRFVSSNVGLKLNNCDGDDDTAIMYHASGFEGEVELQWQAPNDYVGDVLFNATIAQDFDKFWVGITSSPIQIVGNDVGISESYISPSDSLDSLVILPNETAILDQPLAKSELNSDSIYEGCGLTKTCFGLPANCVPQRSCEAIVTATNVDGRYQFEMKSIAVGVTYIALALSRDSLMGDDSVVECVREEGIVSAYTSWNERRGNIREGIPQNIISLISSSLVDGIIYCKYERQPSVIKLETEFNLEVEKFYFMVAIGTVVSPTSLLRHDLGRLSSTEPLEIIKQVDPIYEGCDSDKICFGIPPGCVEEQSCRAIVTATVEDDVYEFELQSGVATVGYVSFALSRDNLMGDDSVIECVSSGGNINAFASWNNPRPSFTNTRQGVEQDIFTLLDSSLNDGKIYCKVRRETKTIVFDHEFDLANEDFYFLLAIGTWTIETSILTHNLGRDASAEQITFPGRGSAYAVRISAITMVIWFLATSFTQFLRGQ